MLSNRIGKACFFPLDLDGSVNTIAYMPTDPQTFSAYASLNRADLTHEPKGRSLRWSLIAKIAAVVAVAAAVLCQLVGPRGA